MRLIIGPVPAPACPVCDLVRCAHTRPTTPAFVRGVCRVRPARDLLTATRARPGTGRHRRRPA